VEEARSPRILLLVPEDLAQELLEPLRAHYAADPVVEPLVERRIHERRSGVDRRMLRLPGGNDHRQDREERRKLADRRAPLLPRDLRDRLPPELAGYAGQLRWAQRMDPVSPHHAGLPTQALVEAIAAGHDSCVTELYWRCYERVYQRLREHMDDATADAQTKPAFGHVLDRLDDFDPADYASGPRTSSPFHRFLMEVVDAFAAHVTPGAVTP
jgi:hypothetical protein